MTAGVWAVRRRLEGSEFHNVSEVTQTRYGASLGSVVGSLQSSLLSVAQATGQRFVWFSDCLFL